MHKIISFSLWGANPKYTVGAIRNAELLSKIYPGWKARFYIGSSVPSQIIYSLEDFNDVEIIEKQDTGNWTSMFWRFEAAYDSDVDVVIFRDTDSRLNTREKAAVDEWLTGDKNFHIMRDHPYHKFPILGGMWGLKKNNKYNIKKMLEDFQKNRIKDAYGTDYNFLGNELYPLIKEDSCVHDEFIDKKSFPTQRNNLQFVGQVFDENENTVKEHLEVLKLAL